MHHQQKTDVEDLLANENWSGLVQFAKQEPARILRYLTGRLCSADAAFKWKTVRAFGMLVADREALSGSRIRELLRRFVWLLSDESGNVPFGIPEAFGEILARRPEFHGEFLPVLCSLAYDPERVQTGVIEEGIIWALGRIGPAVAPCSPEAVEAIADTAQGHLDPQVRKVASWSLKQICSPDQTAQR